MTPHIALQIGPAPISSPVRHISDALQDPIDAVADAVAELVAGLYVAAIASVGAVLSGRFRDKVKVRTARREGATRLREVASGDPGEVPYSGVVEFGWLHRARGQESYPGRFPARKAVSTAKPFVRDAIAGQMMRYGFGH